MPETDPTPDAGARDVSLMLARYWLDRDERRGISSRTSGPSRATARTTAALPRNRTPMVGRMQFRAAWVDRAWLAARRCAREFDNLPLAGKPMPGIGVRHDPDLGGRGAHRARSRSPARRRRAIQLGARTTPRWTNVGRAARRGVGARGAGRVQRPDRRGARSADGRTARGDTAAGRRARGLGVAGDGARDRRRRTEPADGPGGGERYSRSSSAGRIVVGMANASATRTMPPTKSQAPQV